MTTKFMKIPLPTVTLSFLLSSSLQFFLMTKTGSCISTHTIIRFEPMQAFNLVSNELSEVPLARMTQIEDFGFQFFDK